MHRARIVVVGKVQAGAAMLVLPRSAGRGLQPRQPHRNVNGRGSAWLQPQVGG